MSTMPEKPTPILKDNRSIYYFEHQLCWQDSHATKPIHAKDTYKPGVLCCPQHGHASLLILKHNLFQKDGPHLLLSLTVVVVWVLNVPLRVLGLHSWFSAGGSTCEGCGIFRKWHLLGGSGSLGGWR